MARRVWIFRKVSLTQARLTEKKMTGSHRGLLGIVMRDMGEGLIWFILFIWFISFNQTTK